MPAKIMEQTHFKLYNVTDVWDYLKTNIAGDDNA